MQIAISGQSWQVLLFCLSGQHGMSAAMSGMSAICIISAGMACSAATAGAASGAIVKPAVTRMASTSRNNRRTFISRDSHKRAELNRPPRSQIHQRSPAATEAAVQRATELIRTIAIQSAVQVAEVAVNHLLMLNDTTFVRDRKPLDSAGVSGWNNELRFVERSFAWSDTQGAADS
jgi:hypothetical protein